MMKTGTCNDPTQCPGLALRRNFSAAEEVLGEQLASPLDSGHAAYIALLIALLIHLPSKFSFI